LFAAYNILSSINDSNSLCPWKGWVHVFTELELLNLSHLISKSSILSIRLPWSRLSFLIPENGSRVSSYVSRKWLLKGLDLLGDWKGSCKSSVRKWETLKRLTLFSSMTSLFYFLFLSKLIVKYFKDEMKCVLERVEH
jgi:hypothetical protein